MTSQKLVRFENCKILKDGAIYENEYLFIRDGKIEDQMKLYFDERVEPDVRIDCKGGLLSPGLLDIQINGGFGVDFAFDHQRSEEGLAKVSKGLLKFGVTGFCPTIVSSQAEIYEQILSKKNETLGAINLGYHLEGPFINAAKVGAHVKKNIIPCSNGMQTVMETYKHIDHVKIITLAPEIEGVLDVIPELKKKGIAVSIGHSMADLNTAEKAVQNGATLITHLFNAMHPFHHRDPGILGLLTSENIPHKPIYFGLINDGCHTDPAAVRIAYRVNYEGLVLVTDAVSALGLDDGIHQIGELKISISGHCAHILGTNILCGSIRPLNECVKLLDDYNNCGKVKALQAATLHPARAIGIADTKGSLSPGCDADIVLFDDDFNVMSTWIGGCCVYEKNENVTKMIEN